MCLIKDILLISDMSGTLIYYDIHIRLNLNIQLYWVYNSQLTVVICLAVNMLNLATSATYDDLRFFEKKKKKGDWS